ncbi:MAG: T9SS type A sorting domain-containing protein [Calditrichota bacterium]
MTNRLLFYYYEFMQVDTRQPSTVLLSAEAFPNPFNHNLNISFTASNQSPISIGLYDANGRIVRRLPLATYPSGMVTLSLNASSYPVGRYFLRLRNNQSTKIIPVDCLK